MKKFLLVSFSAVFVLVGVAGSLFVGYRAYEESERNKIISAEIRSLEEEANRVDQENRKLRDRIEYLQSDSFREQEAKRVLEYQKSNENVIFIRERFGMTEKKSESGIFSEEKPSVLGVSREEVSNFHKWWQEFFGKEVRVQ